MAQELIGVNNENKLNHNLNNNSKIHIKNKIIKEENQENKQQ